MTFPALTYEELTSPDTEDLVLSYLLTQLGSEGLPVTSWQEGDPTNTLVRIDARALTALGQSIANAARGGLLGTGSTSWLRARAAAFYREVPKPATTAKIRVHLAASGSAPTATITPGMLWLAVTQAPSGIGVGLRYNSSNTDTLTLGASGTLNLEFTAEGTGSKYNLSANPTTDDVLVKLQTTLAGVTAHLVETTSGSGTCMVTRGDDIESNASLVQRCRDKWATLAGLNGVGGATAAAYRYYAKSAHPDITRAKVITGNPDGPGSLRVVVAGDAGAFSPSTPTTGASDAVSVADAAVQGIAPVTATVTTVSATTRTLAVTGTASRVASVHATDSDARAFLATRLQILAQSIDIGGTVSYAAALDAIFRPEFKGTGDGTDAVTVAAHVANVTGFHLAGGTADVALGAQEVVVFDVSTLTIVTA